MRDSSKPLALAREAGGLFAFKPPPRFAAGLAAWACFEVACSPLTWLAETRLPRRNQKTISIGVMIAAIGSAHQNHQGRPIRCVLRCARRPSRTRTQIHLSSAPEGPIHRPRPTTLRSRHSHRVWKKSPFSVIASSVRYLIQPSPKMIESATASRRTVTIRFEHPSASVTRSSRCSRDGCPFPRPPASPATRWRTLRRKWRSSWTSCRRSISLRGL